MNSKILDNKKITLDDVSFVRKGESVAIVIDTRMCPQAVKIAKNARLFLCESTYLDEHKDLAFKHLHLTAKEAALIAKEANVSQLILTQFSARYQSLDPFLEESRQIFPNTELAKDLKYIGFPKN